MWDPDRTTVQMRKFFLIAAVMLTAGSGVADAVAQVRLPPARAQQYQPPRIRRVPSVQIPLLIPPSAALSAAMRAAPGAKPLGVTQRGPLYIVKLKQGNTVRRVRVNGATGMVAP